MKMMLGIIGIVLISVLIIPMVSATEEKWDIPAYDEKKLGWECKAGDIISWNWYTEDGEEIDFHLTDGDNVYHSIITNQDSETYKVPHQGRWNMVFYNDNDYTVSVFIEGIRTSANVDNDDGDTPGISLAGITFTTVIIMIGIVIFNNRKR